MTMKSVVNNYLRWFRLKKAKRALLRRSLIPGRSRSRSAASRLRNAQPDWRLQPALITQRPDCVETTDAPQDYARGTDFSHSFVSRGTEDGAR
jgi:hypothetical protein